MFLSFLLFACQTEPEYVLPGTNQTEEKSTSSDTKPSSSEENPSQEPLQQEVAELTRAAALPPRWWLDHVMSRFSYLVLSRVSKQGDKSA